MYQRLGVKISLEISKDIKIRNVRSLQFYFILRVPLKDLLLCFKSFSLK